MFNQTNYIIGVVPSFVDKAKFCSAVSNELPFIKFSNQEIFLPISPSFQITERGLSYFVKEIQDSISFLHNIRIDWGTVHALTQLEEVLVTPSNNQLIHTLAKYIRNAIIDSRFISAIHESKESPELSIHIPAKNVSEFSSALLLDFSWSIESISFLEFTQSGWQEKFFLPLAEQRQERTKSHAILPSL